MNRVLAIIMAVFIGAIGGYFLAAIIMCLFNYNEGVIITYIISFVIVGIVTYFVFGYRTRCDFCGRLFANYEISREELERRETTMTVKNARRDKYGKIIDYYDETVPAIEIIYLCKDRCSYCGHIREIHRSEKIRK